MSIPTTSQPESTIPLLDNIPIVDPRTGYATEYFAEMIRGLVLRNQAGNRIIPCNASGTNVITLTPLAVSPLLTRYNDYDIFTFEAANNSTGAVTMTVVPTTGSLATLKAYKTNGSAQAGSGDVLSGSLYLAIYNDSLDSTAGGFVLK